MKGVVAVNAAFQSADFAMHDIFIDDIHGINGFTPEDTMRHMGEIASPGMIGTEKTIVDILQEKGEQKIEKERECETFSVNNVLEGLLW